MKKQQPKSENGFSLIEAVVAALLLGVALLGLARLQGTIMSYSGDSRMRTHALNLAQEKMEELRNFSRQDVYDALASGNDSASGANATFTRTWTISDCTNAVECKQANVSVVWTDHRNSTQTVQLTSYIGKADPVRGGVALTVTTTTAGGTTSTTSSTSSTTSTSTSSTTVGTTTTSSSTTSSSTTSTVVGPTTTSTTSTTTTTTLHCTCEKITGKWYLNPASGQLAGCGNNSNSNGSSPWCTSHCSGSGLKTCY